MNRVAACWFILASALGVGLGCGSACAQELGRQESQRVFQEAEREFQEGAALLRDDRESAVERFDGAIAGYRRLIEEGGFQSGALHYNIANAYLLSGDVGRAVLGYRRAERLMPGNENIAANLSQARQRVRTRIEREPGERVAELFLFWHYELPARMRFGVLAFASCVFWTLLLVRTVGVVRGAPAWWGAGVAGVVGVSMALSLAVEQRASLVQDEGVVVAGAVVGRKGPAESTYQPSFTQPLHAGVEFTVVEQRVGWALVRLGDGRETWLPAGSFELI